MLRFRGRLLPPGRVSSGTAFEEFRFEGGSQLVEPEIFIDCSRLEMACQWP